MGVRYRIRTSPSGKRAMVSTVGSKVVGTRLLPKIKLTKSRRRLKRSRRRIGI